MLVCTSGWELVWLKQGRRFDPCVCSNNLGRASPSTGGPNPARMGIGFPLRGIIPERPKPFKEKKKKREYTSFIQS